MWVFGHGDKSCVSLQDISFVLVTFSVCSVSSFILYFFINFVSISHNLQCLPLYTLLAIGTHFSKLTELVLLKSSSSSENADYETADYYGKNVWETEACRLEKIHVDHAMHKGILPQF